MTEVNLVPKFAPASGDSFISSSDLFSLAEVFGENFFSGDLDGLDFVNDFSALDASAFDMEELIDIGVEVQKREETKAGDVVPRVSKSREVPPIKDERRERNREHAKKSRTRKKVMLDTLQDSLNELKSENHRLRRIVTDRIPEHAPRILEQCTMEDSLLLDESAGVSGKLDRAGDDPAKVLVESDFKLIQALVTAQQNFVVTDPSLPDNPIIYATEGFCKLTGYKRHDVIGRNCRFMQGPGTDSRAVDLIRQGVAEGKDVSVCLLNYKADGTPFWNQFFVAALRDAEGAIVNHIGVQCEVDNLSVAKMKERVKRIPIP